MTDDPIIQALIEDFIYEAHTGNFYRVKAKHKKHIGLVGSKNNGGYLKFKCRMNDVMAHRAAWAYTYGYWPEEIDHLNRDKTDNRLNNLENVSRIVNAQRIGITKSNKSGLLGASKNVKSGKYLSTIRINKKQIYLGSYDTAEDANKAYLKAKYERDR